ncbi:hypothetical protein C8F04DRAFT_1176472 [Mycena alexandri]|uniref:DUF218 domain-containing protein n=1 Tax=Mycena alexandri TaxID=1745969 RepID=A0AAD6T9M5_9AGAR|nr:hypothetical protein C8F04DRAFT_1176472 [Mycena alexandri]
MPLEHVAGAKEALLVLFQCAVSLLERETASAEVAALQKRCLDSFCGRTEDHDIWMMDLRAITHVLLFSEEDRQILLQTIELFGASATEQTWFTANIDQANHFIKRRLRTGSSEMAMLDRFCAVADIQYLNDQGRLAENLARQAQENVAALEYAQSINYSQYAYGALVVLGHSPTPEEAKNGTTCSQMTKDKVARCVGLNRGPRKLAPLYIVCGGSVRPQLTCINEGLVIKYMVEYYGIPAEQILIDATSEHTYSNFMNAVLCAREAQMPEGTKLGVFLVPDWYGNRDQYTFCVSRMWKRAGVEVFPAFDLYFSMVKGAEDRAIEVVLGSDQRNQEVLFGDPQSLYAIFAGFLPASITSHLEASWTDNAQLQELAVLARTCTGFRDIALDALWRYQDGILNLIWCMPADLWETVEGGAPQGGGPARRILVRQNSNLNEHRLKPAQQPMRAIILSDWDRALKYSYRIKALTSTTSVEYAWDSPGGIDMIGVFQILRHGAPAEYLLPNLTDLTWRHARADTFRFIDLFLGPHITSLTIREDNSRDQDIRK